MLNIENLSLSLPQRLLIDRLSWQAHCGEVWGVLGMNGCGKSQFIQFLAGLSTACSVSVDCLNWQGQSLAHQSPQQLAHIRRFCPQMSEFPQWQTVEGCVQEVEYWFNVNGLASHPLVQKNSLTATSDVSSEWIYWKKLFKNLGRSVGNRFMHQFERRWENDRLRNKINNLYYQFELYEKRSQLIGTLSGGEKQRLALLLTALQQGPLILLDEPLNHLDFRHQLAVMDWIKQQANDHGALVIAVFHDYLMARRSCSHVLLLGANGQWQTGQASVLLTPKHLAQLYDVDEKAFSEQW